MTGFNPLEIDIEPQGAPLAQTQSTPPPAVEPEAPAPTTTVPTRTPNVDAKPATKVAPATDKTPPAPSKPVDPAPTIEHTCSCKDTAKDAPVDQPPTAADKKAERAARAAKLAARRKTAGRAILIGAIVIAALLWMKPWETATSLAANGQTTTTTTASDQANATDTISADVTYAEEYLASNGTLDGIIIDGAQLAVRDKTMYAVRTIDGVCTVYGLLNGQRIIPAPDTSGAACAGQIVTVQAQLDAAASQVDANAKAAVEDTLSTATAAATQYASRNFVGGAPSMTGLPNTIAGAAVMENTGDYALLRVSYPGACLETYVTAAGEIGDSNTCS